MLTNERIFVKRIFFFGNKMPSMLVNCEIHEAKNSAKSESFALKKRNKCVLPC